MDEKRERRLEDWVELAAAAVEHARRGHGADEVARRVATTVSDEDYETVVRVLRTMGRDLQASGPDLTALDARLQGHGAAHPHVPEAPEAAAPTEDATPEATPPRGTPTARKRPLPAELALQLAKLRNPIVPHPRSKPGPR